jgi:hypothetical protein
LQDITFVVTIPYKGRIKYTVSIDETLPIIESFARVIEATQGEENEIPFRATTGDGRIFDIMWTFALAGKDGEEMLLPPHMSLEELGVLPNAEIIAEDEQQVGSLG